MATETIFISLVAGSNPPVLHLTDNEGHSGNGDLTTDVDPGDTVIWRIAAQSTISSISSIYRKEGSQDVFSTQPATQTGGFWKGIVSSDATGQETYGIKYYIEGDSTEYDCDPIIKVKV